MTAEHTPDTDAALTPAPKKTRRAAPKAAARSKKKPSDDATLTQDEASVTATGEKKKIPARRPRKKTPLSSQDTSLDIPAASTAESMGSEFEQNTPEEPIQKVVKPRAPRGRKPNVRAKDTKKEDFSAPSTLPEEQAGLPVVNEVAPVEEKAASSAKRGRGRLKKVPSEKNDTSSLHDVSDVQEQSLRVAEPQSAGIEREVTDIPDIPTQRDERKARRPRRVPKAKNYESLVKAEKDFADEKDAALEARITEEHGTSFDAFFAPLTDETFSPVVADKPEEAFDDEADFSATSESSSKSRRGRRGGRGKRGKKRNLTTPPPVDVLQYEEDFEDDDFESSSQAKKNLLSKGGTSLSEGKPGRARTAVPKKPVEVAQRKMFISMVQGEQVEVALVENGIIHEYYLEMLHQVKTKGNIYKGVVNNIDANLQAAFVNYGANKNGFLQIDEIHPEYYQAHHEVVKGKKFPPIQKIIKPGQEILVQVVKEPTGNKGAFLTTWLSLPGRFLVLTPGQEQIGVSRKVESDEERLRLREMMTGIEPGAGLGVIVRTVSAGTSKTTLKSDLQYLKRVWREIRKRGVSESAPVLLYRESGLAERAIRDYLTDDVTEVWVDNTEVAERLRETVSLLFPRKKELIRMHADVRQTLWERFNMHRQLEQIYAREVVLPSGGRLVFDQTEALMAIDINSGKISGKGNFESMALKTNIEAAEAIARHLKLRDIGGQVVIDFIEMRDKSHVREVEKTLRNAMKNDRARHDVARISSFGLLEIVRQRTGSSALAITMEPCPHCRGTGVRRNLEWQALQALCEMERKGRSAQHGKYIFETTSSELAMYLLNHKRQRISELEEQLRISIEVRIH